MQLKDDELMTEDEIATEIKKFIKENRAALVDTAGFKTVIKKKDIWAFFYWKGFWTGTIATLLVVGVTRWLMR